MKAKKLIDILQKALVKAGYEVVRDGWTEAVGGKDECEWLDVKGEIKNNIQTTVHFYFSKNSSRLDEVEVWQEGFKLQAIDDSMKRIF